MIRSIFFTIFFTVISLHGFTQKTFNAKNLAVKWRLIKNDFQDSEKSRAVFTLTNKSSISFPSSHWTIYFNSSREIDTQVTNGVNIMHVNGDIYKIAPTTDFIALKKNDSIQINYSSNGLTLNRSAVPSGLYIVWDNEAENGFPLSSFTAEPFKNTGAGQVTPQKIYQQNSIIKDIPADKLPKIFPTPLSYKETGGEFLLEAGINIQSDALFKKEADYLSEELELMFEKKLSSPGGITGKKIVLKKAETETGAYHLSVTADEIIIEASTGEGIFYGIQSLRSLMPPPSWNGKQSLIRIPAVEVEDAPRFVYRSFMLDVARNFKPKKEIFRILDLMAFYKMNVFHFHFSDDEGWRIEIPSLPELTDIGAKRGYTPDGKKMLPASYASGPVAGRSLGSGYYNRADFIEILKYANERHIQVIPEIESPGHARAAIKAMDARYERFMQQGNKTEAERFLLRDLNDSSEYSSAQQWTDNVICVALPSVYNFIDKIVDEFILMYKEAGAQLITIHLGGDEVPAGVWEKSPLCQQLIKTDPSLKNTDDLWYYYFKKVNQLIRSKGLFLSAWEEAGMRKTMLDGSKAMIVNPRFANDSIQLHVWNNVSGWGAEDLPYRLANAGYKVVLSPVSNNYLDLAYYNSPDESGLYWGGFQDIDKPFYFTPFDYYKTSKEDAAGNPIDPSVFVGKDRLTDFGKSNIVGIEGLLWGENSRSEENMYYLLLPKLLGVAERAWAKDPEWAITKDKIQFEKLYHDAWSEFVNIIGKRELPRLDHLSGGFKYRIPMPGATVKEGKVIINTQFPGLVTRFTTDGSEPTIKSMIYKAPISSQGKIKIKTFDGTGRGSSTTEIENKW